MAGAMHCSLEAAPPCAFAADAARPWVAVTAEAKMSRSKRRKLRDRRVAVRKALINSAGLKVQMPFLQSSLHNGQFASEPWDMGWSMYCALWQILERVVCIEAALSSGKSSWTPDPDAAESCHDRKNASCQEPMGDTSGKTEGKVPRDDLMKKELVLRELGAKSEDESGWEPLQPACLIESAKEEQARSKQLGMKGQAVSEGIDALDEDAEGVIVGIGNDLAQNAATLCAPCAGEETDGPRTTVCRGEGHISCKHCFFTDDRFGRSWRCERQCMTINGVWGPSICSAACQPTLSTSTGEQAPDAGEEDVKEEGRRSFYSRR